MKKPIILLAMSVIALYSSIAFAQPTTVYVSYTADDNIGSRLVYAFRERLRSSQGLSLVDTEAESFLQISIVTIDPDDRRLNTIYSAVITTQIEKSLPKIYLNNFVGICSSSGVDFCADSLTAEVDHTATLIREVFVESIRRPK